MIEVIVCQTGMKRHAPELREKLPSLATIECFDRCETCERFLIARIGGSLMKLADEAELHATLAALAE